MASRYWKGHGERRWDSPCSWINPSVILMYSHFFSRIGSGLAIFRGGLVFKGLYLLPSFPLTLPPFPSLHYHIHSLPSALGVVLGALDRGRPLDARLQHCMLERHNVAKEISASSVLVNWNPHSQEQVIVNVFGCREGEKYIEEGPMLQRGIETRSVARKAGSITTSPLQHYILERFDTSTEPFGARFPFFGSNNQKST